MDTCENNGRSLTYGTGEPMPTGKPAIFLAEDAAPVEIVRMDGNIQPVATDAERVFVTVKTDAED